MRTKTYPTFEAAYKDQMGQMVSSARTHLFNADFAVDAAHDAFEKVVAYLRRGNKKSISTFILNKELLRACRRINKKFGFVGLDTNGMCEYNS